MTASEFVAASRLAAPAVSSALLARVAYQPAQPGTGAWADANADFRAAVVAELLPDFTLADHPLIQQLFAAELACEAVMQQHGSLYQLCFYLYELGQLVDVFALYDAKFNARNMDVGCLLDRELITVGHPIPVVQRYVRAEFEHQPALAAQYPDLLPELQHLLDHPDHDSEATYRQYLHHYFHALPLAPISLSPLTPSGYQPRPKKWWQFWWRTGSLFLTSPSL